MLCHGHNPVDSDTAAVHIRQKRAYVGWPEQILGGAKERTLVVVVAWIVAVLLTWYVP